MLQRVANVMYGGDPEGFFAQQGRVIGAEKVIPKGGLKPGNSVKPTVVLDGVQFELNPPPSNALRILSRNISTAFEMIRRQIEKAGHGVGLCWEGLVDVGRTELDTLSPECRILGCKPSKNVYGHRPIMVDPTTYTKRSVGGHLHFGFSTTQRKIHKKRVDLIPLMDIFVGNTCVMLDRDPGAAERRENYGRAGEYREPKYGVEYRTLSNFWLRHPVLMELVYGLSQFGLSVLADAIAGGEIEDELVETISIDNFIRAIESNDWGLARHNFITVVAPFIHTYAPKGFILNADNLLRFDAFCMGVKDDGLERFFPGDPVEHWTTVGPKWNGFEDFLQSL